MDLELVRERAERAAEPDDVLDFYAAALELGATPAEAERADTVLTVRVMRARGAV